MASITTTGDGKSRRYIVNYRDPEGRQRRKTFTKKSDAGAFAATTEADKLRGVFIDPNAGKATVQEYAESWLAAQTFDVVSRDTVERQLRLHVYPSLGAKQLRQLKPSTVQAWLRGLSVTNSTYRRMIFGQLSSVLSAAVDDDLIPKNPCQAASVKTPKLETRKVIPWSAERVHAVRDAMAEEHRIAVILAAGLGLRQGEVFGLAVSDVDFLRGTVSVRRQVRLLPDGTQKFRPPKGRKQRDVPLAASVRDALAAHLAAYPAVPVTLPDESDDDRPITVDLVCGQPMNRNNFNRKVWAPTLRQAGVPAARDNGMHALRHFFASVLLDAGESIKAVSEYLGHTDAGFTLRTYTHLMPTSDARTRAAVDAAMGGYNTVTCVVS